MTTKFDVEKLSGKNDFRLWKFKMKALLVQHGLAEALKPEPKGLDAAGKAKFMEISEKAHSAIVLTLGDKVLREVSQESMASGVCNKLESLYLTKSLANRLLMKRRLYSYKIVEDRGILDQVDDFSKMTDDLENAGVKLEEEDKAVMLLNALPSSYDLLRDAIVGMRN